MIGKMLDYPAVLLHRRPEGRPQRFVTAGDVDIDIHFRVSTGERPTALQDACVQACTSVDHQKYIVWSPTGRSPLLPLRGFDSHQVPPISWLRQRFVFQRASSMRDSKTSKRFLVNILDIEIAVNGYHARDNSNCYTNTHLN